jgi:hypothetical protein
MPRTPKIKTYKIRVTETHAGVLAVSASSLKEAIKIGEQMFTDNIQFAEPIFQAYGVIERVGIAEPEVQP